MATQHPDAASKYVSIQEEPEEAIHALTKSPKGLGFDEIMVDFEGKLTPYQQTSQIVLGLLRSGIIPGKDVKVTPRIPSGREEGIFRQLMALMSIVESNYHSSRNANIEGVNEVVLPMTTEAKELINLKERIIDVIDLAHKEFGLSKDPKSVNIIPLFESIPPIINCSNIISEYYKGLKMMNAAVKQVRVMLGFSDLSLSYGMSTAALIIKVALHNLQELTKHSQIEILPILGGGTLPFRGFVSHENESLFEDYPHIRTITAQSAIRYDYELKESGKLISWTHKELSKKRKVNDYSENQIKKMLNFAGCFALCYFNAFSHIMIPAIKISDLVPSQRDRLARKSDVGYARDVAHPEELAKFIPDKNLAMQLRAVKLKSSSLPRAISFTAALYSIGLPPEFLGIGRGLKMIVDRYGRNSLNEIKEFYPGLKSSIEQASRYLFVDLAKEFFSDKTYKIIKSDIENAEQLLEIDTKNLASENQMYKTIIETMIPTLRQLVSSEDYDKSKGYGSEQVAEWMKELGKIRKALG